MRVKTRAQSLFYPGALQNAQGVNIHQMNKTHDVIYFVIGVQCSPSTSDI